MEHVPETDLLLFAVEADSLAEPRKAAIAKHVASCAECRATSNFFAAAEEELHDPDVWEPIVASPTMERLEAYAETIAAEDADAESLLAPLIASPGTLAWTNVRQQKRFHSGGVVRKLCAHAQLIFRDQPLVALTFADAAISIAEALPDGRYPAKAVHDLRGNAWKERANALMLLGQCAEALESLNRAERSYRHLTFSAYGLSSVALARASVL